MARILRLLPLVLALSLVAAAPSLAHAVAPINASFFSNVAIEGTDPVAFFTEGRVVAGRSDITTTYRGAVWQFATAEHRDMFTQDPERFAPQYGGYCAYGMTVGQKVPIDPEAWSIVEGKLYLNTSLKVHELWSVDPASNIATADSKWPSVKDR